MTAIRYIAMRELKVGFRNPWAYSFIALFSLFMLSIVLINLQNPVDGYSGITATIMNLMVYLLPLMAFILGSFSLTGDKEEGNWQLLSTYPITTFSYILGKYLGLIVLFLVFLLFGFGFAGSMAWLIGIHFDHITFIRLFLFSFFLLLLCTSLSFMIGAFSISRWQALSITIGLWFFMIIAWSPMLIAFLGLLPYIWIKPTLTALTFLNPAELTRLFTIVKLGGGSTLGPEYYEWISGIRGPYGNLAFLAFSMTWILITLSITFWTWERGRGSV